MYDRMQELTEQQIDCIHNASMDLMKNAGIVFNDEEAVGIFKRNGFRVDGKTVYFEERQVLDAVRSSPSRFTVEARNPEKSVVIGGENCTFAPGYGAPLVITAAGLQRKATMEDYDNFCRLVHTSPHLDMNGWMMVDPSDVATAESHRRMILSNLLYCDRPFMGSPISRQGAREGLEMVGIAWGGSDAIDGKAVIISLINPFSPLQFSGKMAGSLIETARWGQPCVVASSVMAGASGPANLDGVLALQNAETLAGITLAQTVRRGTPTIYGANSSAMDMRRGGLSIGAPVLSRNIHYTAQIARRYGIPSRSGGALTDAMLPDAQAGIESAVSLTTAVRSGIHFILHACGILGTFIGMSFEKFVIDEELCGMARRLTQPVTATAESIDVEAIKTVGAGGQYLTHPKTFKLCRTEFFHPNLMCRQSYEAWSGSGSKRLEQTATEKVAQRLAAYERPDIDPGIEKDLTDYAAG